jgi:hypothetical protein
VEDSVIGDNVEFTGTIKTKEKVEVKVNNKSMDVESFGACIADNCKLQNVLIQPGTMIWPGVKKKNCELKGIIE